MKIDLVKRRTRSAAMPEQGVTFTRDEQTRINEIARTFAGVPFETLDVLREALARQVIRLEDAQEWTVGADEAEAARREAFEGALLHYMAVWVAVARV